MAPCNSCFWVILQKLFIISCVCSQRKWLHFCALPWLSKKNLRFSVQWEMNVLQGTLSQAACVGTANPEVHEIYINTCCVQGRNIITCLTQCGCRNALCYLLGYIYHWHQGYDSKSIHWASVFPAQSAKGKQNWLVADEGTSFPREDLSKQSHSQIYSKCTMLLLLKFHF